LATRLVGLEGLTSYGLYGLEKYTRHYRRKNYQANPINAVVVLEWDSKQKNNYIYLTNGPVDDPFWEVEAHSGGAGNSNRRTAIRSSSSWANTTASSTWPSSWCWLGRDSRKSHQN
jgi:hypothetical protein